MATFWLVVHVYFWLIIDVYAALRIGLAAHRRGRSFLLWTLATLLPFPSILITWPLLYLLPRCNVEPAKAASPKIAAFLQEVRASNKPAPKFQGGHAV